MTLVHAGWLVTDARSAGRAIGAYNVITLEHAEAIVAGAEAADAPVILQLSHNAIRYHGNRLAPLALACAAIARSASVDVGVHLDHIEDLDLLFVSVDLPITSAMFDASTSGHAENVALTARAAAWAHRHGWWLEAELGEIGGKDGAHAPGVRTDPDEARDYVEQTGVDALAIAVGSSHAMTTADASLDLDLIARIRAKLPVPLVLHGSSGVSPAHLREAVAAGMTKINIGTLLNISFTAGIKAGIEANQKSVDPRKYLAVARDHTTRAVETSLRELHEATKESR